MPPELAPGFIEGRYGNINASMGSPSRVATMLMHEIRPIALDLIGRSCFTLGLQVHVAPGGTPCRRADGAVDSFVPIETLDVQGAGCA